MTAIGAKEKLIQTSSSFRFVPKAGSHGGPQNPQSREQPNFGRDGRIQRKNGPCEQMIVAAVDSGSNRAELRRTSEGWLGLERTCSLLSCRELSQNRQYPVNPMRLLLGFRRMNFHRGHQLFVRYGASDLRYICGSQTLAQEKYQPSISESQGRDFLRVV